MAQKYNAINLVFLSHSWWFGKGYFVERLPLQRWALFSFATLSCDILRYKRRLCSGVSEYPPRHKIGTESILFYLSGGGWHLCRCALLFLP
jgi:hypothetical protein